MVYRSKIDWIEKFLNDRSKTVLDLGCVCHDLDQKIVPWLHGSLCRRMDDVMGVDLLENEVQRMCDDGFNAICANVETMSLERKFDIIVAGDIIEHLENLGNFLQRVKEHLSPDGVFLVTTPNPITWVRFLRVLLKGRAEANKEHTCWFTAKVLRQLAMRNGLEVFEEAYLNDTNLYYPWFKSQNKKTPVKRFFKHMTRFVSMLFVWKPAVLLNSILCRPRPNLSETLCMAFRIKENDNDQ